MAVTRRAPSSPVRTLPADLRIDVGASREATAFAANVSSAAESLLGKLVEGNGYREGKLLFVSDTRFTGWTLTKEFSSIEPTMGEPFSDGGMAKVIEAALKNPAFIGIIPLSEAAEAVLARQYKLSPILEGEVMPDCNLPATIYH